jgi:uncharacterized protein
MRWAFLLLILASGCQSLENKLVFQPQPNNVRAPLPPPLEDIELATADGIKLHARWRPHPNPKGVLLYCHGNAGNLEYFAKLTRQFHDSLECSVLIFDYPGYGRSEGKPSETGCYTAAEAAYDWLTRVQGIPAKRVVIAGESLGGGVATELASKHPHQALVLIRTFTSTPDVAQQKLALMSAKSIMFNQFESLKRIPSCRSPIFIAQADKDGLIPFSQGERLRDACTAPVRFHVLRGLDHNDPLPADFFASLRDFLEQAK